MQTRPKFRQGYTHGGTMHADDVFATAFLFLICDDITITRTSKPPETYDETETVVFDIGMGKYDHHEPEHLKEKRKNGIPYAAFGKLWRDYGVVLAGTPEIVKRVDELLVEPLDFTDNTGEPNFLSTAIDFLNAPWDDEMQEDNTNAGFWKAVDFAKVVISRIVERCKAEKRAETYIKEYGKQKGAILVLEKGCPWREYVVPNMPNVKVVVFPSNRGGWCIQNVPVALDSQQKRVDFPFEWMHEGKNLEIGLTKCMAGNYLGLAGNRADAIKIAQLMLKEAQRNG